MREQVCIVLNERESTKAKAAEALSARLRELGITSSRIPVTEEIEGILKQRLPRVLVLDYLLGDFSTGLDILLGLKNIDADRRPHVLFLTDEPSLQVAVEALREGALHFIELDDPQAIQKASDEIHAILNQAPSLAAQPRSYPKLDDLVFGAPASISLRNQIQEAASKRSAVVFVHGKPGSGVSTVARTLQGMHLSSTFARSIDLKHFQDNLLETCGLVPARDELRLGSNLSLIVEHAEEEDGELLDYVGRNFESLWSAQNNINSSFLILCSNDAQALKAWKARVPLHVISLPGLNERKEDIAAFVQRCVREAEEFAGRKIKPFSPEIITWLGSLAWPGELRQLRSVVIDAAIGVGFGEENIRAALESRLELWEDPALQETCAHIDPLAAAAVLELSGFRYQIAAARLGCSARSLYDLLHPAAVQRKGTPV